MQRTIKQKLNRVINKPYWVAACGWYSYKGVRAASGHMGRCKQCQEGTTRTVSDPELTSISLSFVGPPRYISDLVFPKEHYGTT